MQLRTPCFARRYAPIRLWDRYYLEDNRLLNQASVMVGNPLCVNLVCFCYIRAIQADPRIQE